MTRTQAWIFWVSVLAAVLGGAVVWVDAIPAERLESEKGSAPISAELTDDSAAPAQEGIAEPTASQTGIPSRVPMSLGIGLFAVLSFWAAWHGATVATRPDTVLSGAFWGIVSGVLFWSVFAGLVPATYYFLNAEISSQWLAWLVPSLLTGVVAWQIGFWLGRPFQVPGPASS